MLDVVKSNVGRFAILDQRSYEIINTMCNDEELFKLVYFNGADALSNSLPEDLTILKNTQIFPYNFVPDIQTITDTIINVYFDNFTLDRQSMVFKNAQLKFIIWVNKNNNDLGINTRLNSIMNRIDTLFNYTLGLGVGLTMFTGATAVLPNLFYSGYSMTYSIRQSN
jgi:hypothetical protein